MIGTSIIKKIVRRWIYFLSVVLIISILSNLNLFFTGSKKVIASTEHFGLTNFDSDEVEILSVQSVPFGSYLEMEFYVRFKSSVEVVLIDSKGKTLERKTISVNEGKNKYRFETITPLVHGPYFVSLVLNDRRITKKVEAE